MPEIGASLHNNYFGVLCKGADFVVVLFIPYVGSNFEQILIDISIIYDTHVLLISTPTN